jgi:phosphate starvation-inducible protein PhoH and related proteins
MQYNMQIRSIVAGRSRSIRSVHVTCSQTKRQLQKTPRVLKNENQRLYKTSLDNNDKSIVVAHGPAGTGKTMLAVEGGLQRLVDRRIERMIVTRPAVSVDNEEFGFLPGTLESKLKPWLMPVFDFLSQTMEYGEIENMMLTRKLEIAPLAFMRGRTFENSWILVEEAQNCTSAQLLMVLTRLGKGSKLIITGDPQQHDRGYDENGLTDLVRKLDLNPHANIDVIEFEQQDVQRHPLIPFLLDLYA